jgi:prevent-host-death family protein
VLNVVDAARRAAGVTRDKDTYRVLFGSTANRYTLLLFPLDLAGGLHILIHASIDQRIGTTMERRIDAHIARTQFGQIMDLAVKNNERFVVDRRGEPAVVIMSVQDFIRTAAPPPDWLQKAWAGAKRRGLETVTLDEIDAEIDAMRRKNKRTAVVRGAR